MADNKANEALKDANIKFKVYYTGETSADSGVVEWEYNLEPIDSTHRPWLIKFFPNGESSACSQFVNSLSTYQTLSRGLVNILDAVIVNTKQREAIDKLVDHLLWGELGGDKAHEDDGVIY